MSVFAKRIPNIECEIKEDLSQDAIENPLNAPLVPENADSDPDPDNYKDDIFEELDKDELKYNMLTTELQKLSNASAAIEAFGIDSVTIHILSATGLSTGTCVEAFALEALTPDIAIESLGEKIKEKTAEWSAKIIKMTKYGSEKIQDALSALWTKLSGVFDKLTSKPWNKTKSFGKTAKAHPYKTILIVIGLIGSVIALINFTSSSLPGHKASKDILERFSNKVGGIIDELQSKFTYRGNSFTLENGNTISWNTPEELGFTQSVVKNLKSKLSNMNGELKSAIGKLGAKSLEVSRGGFQFFQHTLTKTVPDKVTYITGSREAGNAAAFATGGILFWTTVSVVWKVWRLVKRIVIGGFSLILNTLRKIVSSVF